MSNPYEPSSPPPDARRYVARQTSPDDCKILQYAQLGLRLLGVMMVVDGIATISGSIGYGIFQSAALQQAGYAGFPEPYTVGWFASGLAYMAAGIYFMAGGRRVIELVFLPVSTPAGAWSQDPRYTDGDPDRP